MSPENKQAGLRGSLEGGQACRSALPRAEPQRCANMMVSRGGAGRLSCTSRATLTALPCKMATPEGFQRASGKPFGAPAGASPPCQAKKKNPRSVQGQPESPCCAPAHLPRIGSFFSQSGIRSPARACPSPRATPWRSPVDCCVTLYRAFRQNHGWFATCGGSWQGSLPFPR